MPETDDVKYRLSSPSLHRLPSKLDDKSCLFLFPACSLSVNQWKWSEPKTVCWSPLFVKTAAPSVVVIIRQLCQITKRVTSMKNRVSFSKLFILFVLDKKKRIAAFSCRNAIRFPSWNDWNARRKVSVSSSGYERGRGSRWKLCGHRNKRQGRQGGYGPFENAILGWAARERRRHFALSK